MPEAPQKEKYLLLDSRNTPIARGVLESPPDAPDVLIRVLDGAVGEVLCHEILCLVGLSDKAHTIAGQVIRRRGEDVIQLKRQKILGSEIRQNLRMPVSFETFIYPLSGDWKGRQPVKALDLSCGGIAFFCEKELREREQMEIVIPITTNPLIVECQVIRQRLSAQENMFLYATKFIDLCHDQEIMLREAVFSVQLNTRGKKSPAETRL